MIEIFADDRAGVDAVDVMLKYSALPIGSPERSAVHKFLHLEGSGCSIAEARFFIAFLKTFRKFDVFLRQDCLEPGLVLRKACDGLFNDLFSFDLSDIFSRMQDAPKPTPSSRLVRGSSRSSIV